jgi:hypothetical protein
MATKALIPPLESDSSFLYYVEATVFRDLRRAEEADIAMELLSAYPEPASQELLNELRRDVEW